MGIFSRFKRKSRKSTERDSVVEKAATESCENKPVKKPGIEIPYGDFAINVSGLKYHKMPLTDTDDRLFTLTLRNQYQRMHEWPEEGCVNVNALGSKETTGTNWVGYIREWNAQRLRELIEEREAVNVHAEIVAGDDEPMMHLRLHQSLEPLRFNIGGKSWVGMQVSSKKHLHNVGIVLLDPEGKKKPHVGIVGAEGEVLFEVQARVSDGYESIKAMCGYAAKEVIIERRESDFDDGHYYHLEFDFVPPVDDWEI